MHNWIFTGLYHAAAMLWEMLWALVLGFGISACLQVFVSKEQMNRVLGGTGLCPVLAATAFGAASSSCSYAAAATMRAVLRKGAALAPAVAFLLASTNLVIELGLVLWTLMGWQFLLAEVIGALLMIALAWGLMAIIRPPNFAATNEEESSCCAHDHEDTGPSSALVRVSNAFVMDWSMLWKELLIGVVVAGFLMALVPADWWQVLFLNHGPYLARVVENAAVGPLVAMASFVCSVGNIPLASLLWSSGCSFGGVISFIYGDLIVLPLVIAYAKYYGTRAAIYLTLVLYASMVGSGIAVDLLFTALHWVPEGPRAAAVMESDFRWNYTTWLDLAALAFGAILLLLHFSHRSKNRSQHAHH